MSNYTQEIQNLVNAALADLDQEHRSGKLANAPVANNHYLVRWVTKALKSQRFGRTVGDDLTRWQKAGRSKGNDAGLLFIFKRISGFYAQFFPEGEEPKVIKDSENVAELEMNHCVAGEDEVILAVNSVQDLNKSKNQASNSAE